MRRLQAWLLLCAMLRAVLSFAHGVPTVDELKAPLYKVRIEMYRAEEWWHGAALYNEWRHACAYPCSEGGRRSGLNVERDGAGAGDGVRGVSGHHRAGEGDSECPWG